MENETNTVEEFAPMTLAPITSCKVEYKRNQSNNGLNQWTWDMTADRIMVSNNSSNQYRTTLEIDKSQIDLWKYDVATIKLYLKKHAEFTPSTLGYIKVNGKICPILGEFQYALIEVGCVKKGETDKLKVVLEAVDLPFMFYLNGTNAPKIVLSRSKDIENKPEIKSISLANHTTANVDLMFGTVDFSFTDIPSNKNMLGIGISHNFNCYRQDNNFCGSRFALSLHEKIKEYPEDIDQYTTTVEYTDNKGNKELLYENLYFLKNNTKKYIPRKVWSSLTRDSQGYWVYETTEATYNVYSEVRNIGGYEYSLNAPANVLSNEYYQQQVAQNNTVRIPIKFLTKNKITKGFNGDGNLVFILDGYNNYFAICYNEDNKITTVLDNYGKTMNFSYNENGLLSEIVSDTQKMAYTYNNNNLNEVSYYKIVDGTSQNTPYKTVSFLYTSIKENQMYYGGKAISKVISSDGYTAELTYTNNGKVASIVNKNTLSAVPDGTSEETIISSYELTRETDSYTTIITDKNQDKEIYKFNDECFISEYYKIHNNLVSSARKYEYVKNDDEAIEEYAPNDVYLEQKTILTNPQSLNKKSYEEFEFDEFSYIRTTYNISYQVLEKYLSLKKITDNIGSNEKETYEYDSEKRCVKKTVRIVYGTTKCWLYETYYTYSEEGALLREITLVKNAIMGLFGSLMNIVFEYSSIVEYTYNSQGAIIKKQMYRKNCECLDVVNGVCSCSSDVPEMYVKEYSYNDNNQLILEKDQTGLYEKSFAYNEGTSILNKTTQPNGLEESYVYDERQRIVDYNTTGLSRGNTVTYCLNETSGLNSNKETNDRKFSFEYDNKRRISKVKLNNIRYESFEYQDDVENDDGKVVDIVTLTNAKNEKFKIEKDKTGTIQTIQYGDDEDTIGKPVPPLPNEQPSTPITSEEITYFTKTYYKDELVGETTEDSYGKILYNGDCSTDTVENYCYNSVGLLTDYTKTCINTNYGYYLTAKTTYDGRGNKWRTSYSGIVDRSIVNTHDMHNSENKISDIKILDQTTSSVYDFNQKFETNPLFRIVPTYDEDGRYNGKTVYFNNNVVYTHSIVYRGVNGRKTNMVASENINGQVYEYTYDCMGNITHVTRNGELHRRYTYDLYGRVVRDDNSDAMSSYYRTYNDYGDITSLNMGARSFEDNAQTSSNPINYTYNGMKLTSYGTQACAYDLVGNPTKYKGKTLFWTKGKRLMNYNGVTFDYDINGKRIKKKPVSKDPIYYYYDEEGRLIYSSDGMEYFYDNTGLFACKYNDNYYVYQKDVFGTIKGLLDSNGNAVVKYIYDAWGYCTVINPATNSFLPSTHIGRISPFRYKGCFYDEETQLYYLNTRYYDPEVGRFLNIDSVNYLNPKTTFGLNLYSYCGNNPVMGYDPMGTDAILITDYDSLPIVGHSVLLIQDETGVWYRTEFNPKASDKLVTIIGEGQVSFKEATANDISKYVNGASYNVGLFRTSGYETIRISGDYTNSCYMANEYATNTYYGDYNFVANNCQDYATKILSGGESDSILTSNVIEVIDETPIVSIPVVEKQIIEVVENISNTVKNVYDGLVNIFNEIIGRIFNW